mmetsp:Transcript_32453/g.80447  ORF Transcript_32453/g.80447 Transcript_32453/m.80447 type:complete len:129 (-) Transcript_32453:93-479(-)
MPTLACVWRAINMPTAQLMPGAESNAASSESEEFRYQRLPTACGGVAKPALSRRSISSWLEIFALDAAAMLPRVPLLTCFTCSQLSLSRNGVQQFSLKPKDLLASAIMSDVGHTAPVAALRDAVKQAL